MTAVTISGHRFNSYFTPEEGGAFPTEYIERWLVEEKEVCLLRKGDKLFYEILDKRTNKTTQGPIETDKQIDETILYLVECQPKIDETGGISFSLRAPPPYIKRWILDDVEICLSRNEDNLTWTIFNNITGKTIQKHINFKGSIDKTIFRCEEKYPQILKKGVLKFFETPKPLLTYCFRNKKVQLLQVGERDLIWQLFDTSTKTVSQTPFSGGHSFKDWIVAKNIDDFMNEFNYLGMANIPEDGAPLKSYLDYFKDHEIVKLEMKPTPHSLTYRLHAVYAKKIQRESDLDRSVIIDHDRWAITLINSGKSNPNNYLSWGGHAAMIIEGRSKGKFFKKKAHFLIDKTTSYPTISLSNEEIITPTQQAETWKVPREKALKMLRAIKKEKKELDKNPLIVSYHASGNSSMFATPLLLRSYASIEDLISVELGSDCIDPSLALRSLEPDKSLTLYPYFFQENLFINFVKEVEQKSLTQDSNKEDKEESDSIRLETASRNDARTSYKNITLIDRNGKKWTVRNPHFKGNEGRFIFSQLVFVQSQWPKSQFWYAFKVPDNCLSWVRNKLKECNIRLKSNKINAFCAFPKNYMNQGIKSEVDYSPRTEFLCEDVSSEEVPDDILSPFFRAIREGDVNKVNEFLREEEKETKRIDLKKGLYLACRYGHIEVVKILLQKGIGINEPIKPFRKSLQVAVEFNKESLVEFLIQEGAKVDQLNPLEDTILHWVARRNSRYSDQNLKIVNLLIKICDINAQNKKGETPLIIATKKGKERLVRRLLENKASVNAKDNEDRTALWYACNIENEEIVRLLTENGCNLIDAQQEGWFTNPFSLVRAKGFKTIEDILNKALDEQKAKKPACLVS